MGIAPRGVRGRDDDFLYVLDENPPRSAGRRWRKRCGAARSRPSPSRTERRCPLRRRRRSEPGRLPAAEALREEGFDGRSPSSATSRTRPTTGRRCRSRSSPGSGDRPIGLPAVDEDLDLDWRLGRAATGLDLGRPAGAPPTARSRFDGLVIATGATPAPPVPEGMARRPPCARSTTDLAPAGRPRRRPARVVVVGAGFIGAEVAATCRGGARRHDDRGPPAPWPGCSARSSGRCRRRAPRPRGRPAPRRGRGRPRGPATGSSGCGSPTARSSTPTSWWSASACAATDWLRARASPSTTGSSATRPGSPAPGVVAAGDVARWPNATFGGEVMRVEHWDNAIEQGAHAARTLLAGEPGGCPTRRCRGSGPTSTTASSSWPAGPVPGDEMRIVDGSLEERASSPCSAARPAGSPPSA